MVKISIDWKSFREPRRKLPYEFPTGMYLFTGEQGGGKTLSLMRRAMELVSKHNAEVFSAINVAFANYLVKEDEIVDKLLVRRSKRPSVFILDEIQVLLGSENVPAKDYSRIVKAISQQRKRNATILGTLQVYHDIPPVFRRQIKAVIRCHYFGGIQIEEWLDGNTLTFDLEKNKYKGKLLAIKIWKRHNFIFDQYDTFELVGDTSS